MWAQSLLDWAAEGVPTSVVKERTLIVVWTVISFGLAGHCLRSRRWHRFKELGPGDGWTGRICSSRVDQLSGCKENAMQSSDRTGLEPSLGSWLIPAD